jgi:phage major head subunit gpT-like protein
MGITNQNILDTASTTFHAKFDEIFENGAPGVFGLYTEMIPTDSKINEIDVLETMPVVREWVGAKQFKDILASNLSATIKSYERSFSIKRVDAITDRTGAIGRRISTFMNPGAEGGDIFDLLAFTELVSASGAGGTGYDGVALFSTAHVRGPAAGNQSNKSTTALSFAEHDTAIKTMTSLRDENGEPLRIAPDTLIVGPKNRKMGMQITQSTERIIAVDNAGAESGTRVAAAAIPNVFGGGDMTLVVDPRLVGTQDDYYYYLDTTKGPRPIIGYVLTEPHAEDQTEMNSEGRFLNDELRFSVEADVVFAPGDWHVAYGGIL